MRSRLTKKCALSLTIGPPSVPPHCFFVVVGLGQVLRADEEVLGGDRRIGPEVEDAAVELVRSLLGDGVDDAAGGAAELGVVLIGEHLEFLDRFERRARLRAEPLAQVVVVVVAAVDHVVVRRRVLAVDVDRVGAKRDGRTVRHHARQQAEEFDVVPIHRRHLGDVFARDVAADLGRGGVDERRLRGHGHRLFDAADFELQVDGGGSSDRQHNVAADRFLEA